MKIRILSQSGDALAVQDRLTGDVETRWDHPPAPDTVVLMDGKGLGRAADTLRKTHFVFGAGQLQDSLETEFGLKIAQANGLNISPAEGPQMTVDAFYHRGERAGVLLSSVAREGNAFCRIWKKPNPKVYHLTLGKCESFLRQFKYSGPLSCEVVIKDYKLHFVRWITSLQAHILWAIGPWLPVVMGLEQFNGHPLSYAWVLVVRVSNQPCYLSAEGNNIEKLKEDIRHTIRQVSVPGKNFKDNLNELHRDMELLKNQKFL